MTGILIGSLACGAGANATLYSAVAGLLFRAPAIDDPERLASIYTSRFGGGRYGLSSYPDFLSIAEAARPIAAVAASDDRRLQTLATREGHREVRVAAVSGSFFALLGLTPQAGRLLSDNAAREAVISFALWMELGGDEAVLGRTLTIGDRDYAIAGVAPRGFTGLSLVRECRVWIPLEPASTLDDRGSHRLTLIARLKPGAGVADLDARLGTLARDLAAAFPAANRGSREAPGDPRLITAVPYSRLDPDLESQVGAIGAAVLGAAAVLLFGACLNAGGLLLSRAVSRRHQFAVRVLLGASRAHLVRIVLAESALVALASAALGLLLAWWTADILPSLFAPEHARFLDLRLDGHAVAATLAIASLAAAAFSIGPALHASGVEARGAVSGDPGGVSDTRAGTRARSVLAAAQVAVATIFTGAAGVLWAALAASLATGFGVAPSRVAIAEVQLTHGEHHEWQGRERMDDIQRAAAAIARVEAVAWSTAMPMARENRRRYVTGAGDTIEPEISLVSRNYFDVMGIALVEGRGFSAIDELHQAPVVIVSDTLAREHFRDSALGRHLEDGYGQRLEIVGVAHSGKHRTLQEPPPPMVYHPMTREYVALQHVIVRAPPGQAPPLEALRSAIGGKATLLGIDTLAARLAGTLAFDRMTMAVAGASAGFALLLAMMGIYGVMNDAVRQRRREIGLRMALGARPLTIGRFVVARALALAAAGLAAGVAAQAAAAQLLSTRVALGPPDAATLAASLGALALAVVVASIVPIRRALRVHPAVTLKAL